MTPQPPSCGGWHNGDRDHDRERHRDGDCQGQVRKNLTFDVLQEQYGQEHSDRRRRRCKQRRHDLTCAVVRRLFDRHAALLQANDVAGDDDGAFDHHADGEREARQ
jgi:hypothetical protein